MLRPFLFCAIVWVAKYGTNKEFDVLEDIKKFLASYKPQGVKSALKSREDYVSFLQQMYGDELDLRELIYMVLNDLPTVPVADCGNIKKFVSNVDGYSEYCTLPKFGPNRCPVCYEKLSLKKVQTNLVKYGCENPAQAESVASKMKATNMERYGVEQPQKLQSVKDKAMQTNMERFGSHPSATKDNQERRSKTMKERYGVHNALLITKKDLTTRYTDFKQKFIGTGFTLLSTELDYATVGNKGIHSWKCDTCNNTFSKVSQCLRCPVCTPYSSSIAENELHEYIMSIMPGVDIIKNSRNVIYGREIDIFIPTLGIGIEFNGEYWHRDEVRDEDYHQDKAVRMRVSGYRLITIYSSEWENQREMVQNRLLNILGTSTVRYARKCVVKELQNKVSSEFIEQYHIQGDARSSVKLGLYDNDELVAVMTFGKPRFSTECEYELIRYCSKDTVVGAAGKLLKYFERTYKPKSIMTYADMNWSTGNLYHTLGFDYKGDTKPGYFYYDRKTETKLSRWQCQKHKLIEKYGFNSDMTEKQMTAALGYFKIFDCGNMVFTKIY